ncbi:jg2440 [Pararge aegeria aegeria]|uniref:Jg2440 protein n=2 Tax=Pararge aegeria TaxID=116150 RepID=A0A8S4QNY0_9NEOP|nr:jg2440 [Pararge aegeria aegeria]
MKNQSENDFRSKFRLLNSQECSEEIIWSCSDSSDYETPNPNENLGKGIQTVNRKRKREKKRKNTSKNLSNLKITIVETRLESKNVKIGQTSPILQKVITSSKSEQQFVDRNSKKVLSSPILCCNSKKSTYNEVNTINSPILVLNHASPKISPNIRKKLFNEYSSNIKIKSLNNENSRSVSPVLNCTQLVDKTRQESSDTINGAIKTNFKHCDNYYYSKNIIKQEITESANINIGQSDNTSTNITKFNKEEENLNDSLTTETLSVALCEKVRSYFNNHFSSETPSQQSISEYDTTPKDSSKTSDEIEIVNSQTNTKSIPQVIALEKKSSVDSLRSHDFEIDKSKKVRYKKDGLAHRLSVLLKKQKANTCLWQHERFLAANSSFVLPNDDFTAFQILTVTYNYGCYVLEVRDVIEKKYFILINHLYMSSYNIKQCLVFKLYRPFKILDFNSSYQLIVNVSKFECT